MLIEKYEKKSFVVIGKEGSTKDSADFINKLWLDANSHFSEVRHLAKKDASGNIVEIWGVMSDFSHSFKPWENFEKGLYLAGVECEDNAEAPEGWTKWIVPSYEYIRVECVSKDTFLRGLQYLQDNSFELVGAVHDYTDSKTGKTYMLFPVRVLQTNLFEE